MSQVRVLVGTKKGAFILTADGARQDWKVDGPLFGGWEIYHLKGSPADPNRLYASQTSEWFGQVLQRSDDGGKTWNPPGGESVPTPQDFTRPAGNRFAYEGEVGSHLWYDGTPHPWEFKRVWHLEPDGLNPDVCYAGVEDAALFKTADGGRTWQELVGLRRCRSEKWQPGAGGLALHTILLDRNHPGRIYVAISAAGTFRSDDSGQTWKPITKGLKSAFELPDREFEVGHCVHRIAMHPARPSVLFMQKHWDVNRSDDAGENWTEVSGDLPSDFGFPIEVHAHEPDTIYVVPLKSDSERYPVDGKLRVYRSRCGGHEWEALTHGLPQKDCYVNVLREATATDSLDPCGVYFGTTGGQVYVSANGGDRWTAIVRDLPPVLSVEVQTLGS